MAGVFLAALYVPLGPGGRFWQALTEALHLLQEYARDHVVLCLLPAFFVAGGISVFLRKESVMGLLGAGAKKVVSYGVASVSGTILAVCSCTVLPIFAGIYSMGAGIGPATTFLYSGPAINALAIILTAQVLGLELGIARAVGAVVFSIIIGLLMHLFFRKDESERAHNAGPTPEPPTRPEAAKPLGRTAAIFAALIGILVFVNLSPSLLASGCACNVSDEGIPEVASPIWSALYAAKWYLAGAAAILLLGMLNRWYKVALWKLALAALGVAVLALLFPASPKLAFGAGVVLLAVTLGTSGGEARDWLDSSWGFAKQILPLLFAGILVSGFLLARPGQEGIIPSHWISSAVGGNSIWSNLFASVAGALMYFATLTEVPILQGLLGSGMGRGPGLALLLAGPALSLPNMLVIRSVLGTKKTLAYLILVVLMATFSGLLFGVISKGI